MGIEIKNTKDISAKYIKVLVHGPSGSGKTRLCATTGGTPLIISAEGGLLSLEGHSLDAVEVSTIEDVRDVYLMLKNEKHKFDWVCLDSISEVAEIVLSSEKKKTNDPRKAYGEMQEVMTDMIRLFRDLPMNVYISAKQDRVKDEVTGQIFFGPSAPGQKIAAALPYFFDEVFALHTWKNEEGKIQSAFQTSRDTQYEAKDRSGKLDLIESLDGQANLAAVCAKIIKKPTKTKE